MIEEKIKDLIIKDAEEENLNIYDISYVKEGNANYLRIMIEKDDYSMDLLTCEKFSEKISNKIDESNIIENNFYLDVCSPGEKREFINENYKFLIGKFINVSFKNKKAQGILKEANDDKIVLEIGNKKNKKELKEIKRKDLKSIKLGFKM